jgi:intracellular septation protein
LSLEEFRTTDMAERPVNPIVKLGLELGPIILFFIGYARLKDRVFNIGGTDYEGFIVVTAMFIPLILISTGLLWALSGKLSRMQVFTAILVVVFGGLGIWFNDERFFKMKPTILYLAFGGILGVGLLQGKSYLSNLMGDLLPMSQEGWMIFTRRITMFFFGLAFANEAVWRLMSTETWVSFKTFLLPVALFAFFISQSKLFSKFGIEKTD